MSNENVEKYISKQEFPTKILASYSLASCALGLMMNIVLGWMPFYYEHVIGLPTILMFIGMTIFTVWDAFNELVAGVFTDKVYSISKRWGRRFPFVLVSSLSFGLVSILLFLPPGIDIAGVWFTLIYFVLILFLYDGLLAFWTVSYAALRSDKFRSDVDRRKIAGLQTLLGTLGGVIGAVTGGLFISLFGGIDSQSAYIITMTLFCTVGTILAILALPGAKDSEKVLNRQIIGELQGAGGWSDFKDFFKVIGKGFKNPNFRAYTIHSMANSIFGAIFAPSLVYFVIVVLKYESSIAASLVTLLAIPFTLMGIILIPLFLYLIRKYGHLKIFKASIVLLPLALIPFLFISDLVSAFILGGIIGAVGGMFGVAAVPVWCDAIDEGSVLQGKRIDAKYNSIIMFFGNVGQLVWYATIWLIHDVFTDYDPSKGTAQSELAVFGIRAQIALVPMIFLLIAAVYFIRTWKLTPQDTLQIKSKLIQMGVRKEE